MNREDRILARTHALDAVEVALAEASNALQSVDVPTYGMRFERYRDVAELDKAIDYALRIVQRRIAADYRALDGDNE